jgi:hypothetical protein
MALSSRLQIGSAPLDAHMTRLCSLDNEFSDGFNNRNKISATVCAWVKVGCKMVEALAYKREINAGQHVFCDTAQQFFNLISVRLISWNNRVRMLECHKK